MEKVTVPVLKDMKRRRERITILTAYDATTARIMDEAGVDVILVGDSLGNVVQGLPNTLPVTMDEMVYHTKVVSRGIERAHLSADMPFMSYQASCEDAIRNAGRFVKESGAQSVKLEVNEAYVDAIHAIYRAGIPVIGHIGLCPQSIHIMGGYKIQGRGEREAETLLTLAKMVEEAGAFILLLEGVPWPLAKDITESVKIPTVGIGAGPYCNGQVLVINDLVGMSPDPPPRFVKRYANVSRIINQAVKNYVADVKEGRFPDIEEHSYS